MYQPKKYKKQDPEYLFKFINDIKKLDIKTIKTNLYFIINLYIHC